MKPSPHVITRLLTVSYHSSQTLQASMQRLVQPIITTPNLLNEIYYLTMKIVSVVIPYGRIHAAKSPA